jgi:hypothetical protein
VAVKIRKERRNRGKRERSATCGFKKKTSIRKLKGADEAHGVAWDAGMVQGADLRITCIVSEDPLVRSEALFRNHPGQLAPQGVERPVHAGDFNGICSVHPVFKAHLRCDFLIRSLWRTSRHLNASISQMHCLRDGAGDHERR